MSISGLFIYRWFYLFWAIFFTKMTMLIFISQAISNPLNFTAELKHKHI